MQLKSVGASLYSLATAVPRHVMTQADIAELTRRAFGMRMPEFDRISKVFGNSGIDRRHLARPGSWYEQQHAWTDRTEVYLEVARKLFVASARSAIDQAGLTPADIDTVITVSSTGIAAPSIEALAARDMGFGSHITRVPVFGLGCAGGVSGLSLAARMAEARPGSNVLLVTLELCSLAVRLDELTKANIVAMALFGDGAAAAVVRSGEDGLLQIGDGGEHMWPDTLNIMGWNVDEQGFGVIFDRSIPPFARKQLAGAVDGILQRQGLARGDIDRFICHPGGQKVIEAIEQALELPAGTLNHERDVLAEYGNMSAPTALFVLDRMIKAGLPECSMLMALGPGFTLSTAMLRRSAA